MARIDLHEPVDLRSFLAGRVPIIDVRAPVEFSRGSIAGSTNLPLLSDAERADVGTTYKRKGREAAIELGHALVNGEVRARRVAAWLRFVEDNPRAVVSCARGGMRSRITCEWLAEAGAVVPRIAGGYKALRAEALAVIEEAARDRDWLILGGKTGCDKTVLLGEFSDALDFERAANHRGSSFGGFGSPQPSQATFENRIAAAVVSQPRLSRLLVEDEGRNLGTLAIPEVMVSRMRRSPVVVLQVPFDNRVDNIVRSYVDEPLASGEGKSALCDRYRAALLRLRKRLGDKVWRELDEVLRRAFGGEPELHRAWVAGVLRAYYDPMYDYQIGSKKDRVVFEGDWGQVRAYLRNRVYDGSSSDHPAGGPKEVTA